VKVDFSRDGDHLRVDSETEAFFLAMDHHETHAGYHTICRSVYAAAKGAPAAENELTQDGVTVLRGCLGPETVRELSERVEAAVGPSTPPNTTVPIDRELRTQLTELLPEILNAEVTAMIEAYLGCHFRAVHCQLYRTETGGEPHVSFLWHRDMEPMAQLHIMVYLTHSHPGDPGTEFLSLTDTRRMAENGYAFPHFTDRIADLAEVLPDGEAAPEILHPRLEAGDATLFAAPRILHRGLDGTGGKRDVFLINLLPSLVPWQNDLARFGGDHLFWEGPDSDTLQTNPFPLIIEPAQRFTGKPVPEWVIMGDMLPEGFGG